jgi:RND family efflux transporter MFP subunit
MEEPRNTGEPDISALRIDANARSAGGANRTRAWLIAAGLVVVVAVVAWFAMAGGTPRVEIATAAPGGRGGPTTLLNASGYVTPRRRATVAAKITARVLDVLVDEGMVVKEGQILARLDDSDAQRRLAAARADRDATAAAIPTLEVNLANAERELRRQQDLERGGVSTIQALDLARTQADSLRTQIDAARAAVKAGDAAIAVAQQDVENCTVRAPFAGVVVSKDAQVGEMVSPISAGGGFTRTGIATIVDMTSLEIEVDVNEANIAKVVPGQRIEATLDAYPDWQMPAHVRTVIPTADRQKATVKVRISFEKLDPRILPDMGVKVAFLGEETSGSGATAARALVPQAAVREEGGRPIVFVVQDASARRRAVTLGAERGADVEILAGVNAGERVVVGAAPTLHDGERVRVKR